MNTNSNQELQLQLTPESEDKANDLNGLSAFKKILTLGGIALMTVLIQFGNEHINGKTTVAATLHDDYLAASILPIYESTSSRLMADAAKLLPIDLSDENNRNEFLVVPYFSEETKQEIITGFEQGTLSVGVVYVRDNFARDGDAIQIVSSGLAVDIPLSRTPTLFFLPFTPGESLIFRGLYDDGDGIAATIETPSGTVSLPVLVVGQTIELPVY